ncbi:membrane protein PM19L isoform X1 [Diospyros lotus]|uniref:membrane protein PM19L isoform X1 n=1 Tax=Diospyros lotus TaxID=55363 RepID=UPI0022572107|nr:membrane protein PM19L isoform X1 [Diospyros lotus]
MASGAGKSTAFVLLMLNLILYLIVMIISAWAINHGTEKASELVFSRSSIRKNSNEQTLFAGVPFASAASALPIPARLFPIFFPIGNMATGFFVIFSLIAGVVGFITSLTGINNVFQGTESNLHAAAASSLTTWALTLLAMGLACKEINVGWTDSNLRTLEVILILLSGTQLFCTGAIHAEVEHVAFRNMIGGGRL